MNAFLRGLTAAAVVIPTIGTMLSLIRHPHWAFRVWDFPRTQLATVATIGIAIYSAIFFEGDAIEIAMLVVAAIAVLWQLYNIHPYTPFIAKQVKSVARPRDRAQSISVVMSNVQMENKEYDRLIALVREIKPDVLIAVETDSGWTKALESALSSEFEHRLLQPQENWYGKELYRVAEQ